VLRPGGIFVVSTPDRAIYSARGEHFNQYHLLELTEPEFGSYLRGHFAHATVLHQRAIFGSVIAASEGSGWRSYERRAPEHIEASRGLARSPYMVGVASDVELPQILSTAYMDRRNPEEVWRGYVAAPAFERERDAARGALTQAETRAAAAEVRAAAAGRRTDAETQAIAADLERERDAARAALSQAEERASTAEADADTKENTARALADALRAALVEAEGRLSELSSQLEDARAGWIVRFRRKTRPLRRALLGGPRD